MKARIINNNYGDTYSIKWLNDNQNIVFAGQLVSEWELTDVLPSNDLYKPIWDSNKWVEGATPEEIEAIEDSKYPCNVTALQFELELIYSDLTTAIDNAVESLDEPTKTIVKLKRSKATEFDRKDQFIQQLGQAAGMTKADINEFFLRASNR